MSQKPVTHSLKGTARPANDLAVGQKPKKIDPEKFKAQKNFQYDLEEYILRA